MTKGRTCVHPATGLNVRQAEGLLSVKPAPWNLPPGPFRGAFSICAAHGLTTVQCQNPSRGQELVPPNGRRCPSTCPRSPCCAGPYVVRVSEPGAFRRGQKGQVLSTKLSRKERGVCICVIRNIERYNRKVPALSAPAAPDGLPIPQASPPLPHHLATPEPSQASSATGRWRRMCNGTGAIGVAEAPCLDENELRELRELGGWQGRGRLARPGAAGKAGAQELGSCGSACAIEPTRGRSTPARRRRAVEKENGKWNG
jgi:hypothetical protein